MAGKGHGTGGNPLQLGILSLQRKGATQKALVISHNVTNWKITMFNG